METKRFSDFAKSDEDHLEEEDQGNKLTTMG